ncbi:MAG: intradiol ring-cleavage dioxygenase [Bacteroidota bacterium]
MDHDDLPIGRFLSRREALALLGVGGTGLLVGCGTRPTEETALSASASGSAPSPCLVKPEQTEGPFFFEDGVFRRDIRSNVATGEAKAGVPLTLTIAVSRLHEAACEPIENAIVDIWHCDALGAYSGYAREGTEGETFCRGFQRTDAAGEASFLTIYPGWYRGRATHIHLKVRTSEEADAYEFTSQLYFPDSVSDEIAAMRPYAAASFTRVRNNRDGIYMRGGGNQLLLAPTREGDGYAARFDFALDLSDAATGRTDRFG